MVLKSKTYKKIRNYIWPSMGINKYLKYVFIRLIRLQDSSYRVSIGFAIGAGISVLPIYGLHIVVSIFIAFIFRGSILAATIGTFTGNPITFVIYIYISKLLGDKIDTLLIHNIYYKFKLNFILYYFKIPETYVISYIKWFLGAIPFCLIITFMSYFIIKYILKKLKDKYIKNKNQILEVCDDNKIK